MSLTRSMSSLHCQFLAACMKESASYQAHTLSSGSRQQNSIYQQRGLGKEELRKVPQGILSLWHPVLLCLDSQMHRSLDTKERGCHNLWPRAPPALNSLCQVILFLILSTGPQLGTHHSPQLKKKTAESVTCSRVHTKLVGYLVSFANLLRFEPSNAYHLFSIPTLRKTRGQTGYQHQPSEPRWSNLGNKLI